MNKKVIYCIIILLCIFIVTGCKKKIIENNNQSNTNDNYKEVISSMKITIDNELYIINLEENETVSAFINLLPIEFNMNELNGNEKYYYLDKELPTNSINVKHINKGDVMLYGNNCLVIFNKSFDTTYSYTKIGYIDNLKDLDSNNIKVKIEK